VDHFVTSIGLAYLLNPDLCHDAFPCPSFRRTASELPLQNSDKWRDWYKAQDLRSITLSASKISQLRETPDPAFSYLRKIKDKGSREAISIGKQRAKTGHSLVQERPAAG
jgi:hypothetical protein